MLLWGWQLWNQGQDCPHATQEESGSRDGRSEEDGHLARMARMSGISYSLLFFSHSCTIPVRMIWRLILSEFCWDCGDGEDQRGRLGSDNKFCVIQVSIKEGLTGHWHWCLAKTEMTKKTNFHPHSLGRIINLWFVWWWRLEVPDHTA